MVSKVKIGIVPIIKIAPHEAALKSLRSLEEQKLWQQGNIKEYHSRITEIIRRYFEERFNFLALEMTSSEVLLNLRSLNEGNKIMDITNSFLSNADLVKFAKFQPIPSVNEEMMKQAYEIVETTKPEIITEKAEEVSNV